MRTLKTTASAGPDKVLRIEIPVANANQPYELTIVISPSNRVDQPEEKWPPGFLETYIGCIDDESFQRPEQGEYPIRESLD